MVGGKKFQIFIFFNVTGWQSCGMNIEIRKKPIGDRSERRFGVRIIGQVRRLLKSRSILIDARRRWRMEGPNGRGAGEQIENKKRKSIKK